MKTTDFIKESQIADDAHIMHADHEIQMAREECYHSAANAIKLHKLLKQVSEQEGIDAWASEKISLANDYLRTVCEWLEYELMSKNSESEMTIPAAFDEESAEQMIARALSESAKSRDLTENAEGLNVGDDVIITGNVEFRGKTGVIDSFGRDKRFVVVNLYNHGRHSFHSSDVSVNHYADSDEEETRMYDSGAFDRSGVAEGDLDRFKKYTRPVVKTTPKIERTTNPSGRTTDHVEWKVTSPTGEIHRYNSKKQAQQHFDSFSKQGVAEGLGNKKVTIQGLKNWIAKAQAEGYEVEEVMKGEMWRAVNPKTGGLKGTFHTTGTHGRGSLWGSGPDGTPADSGTLVIKQGVAEEWSQKYKSSINCSHPKGFSQKAHCAGKKKHNESIEMEMTCPDCGMCQTHGNLNEIKKGQPDSNGYTKCWPGKHAEGTKKGKNGGQVRDCVPNESLGEDAAASSSSSVNIAAAPPQNLFKKPVKRTTKK